MKSKMENSKLNLHSILPSDLQKDNTVFVCIGSDLSIGDSLGPLVGTELEKLGFHVIGTLEKPLHGLNMKERLGVFFQTNNKIVIAIDASIGTDVEVGTFEVKKGPIHPGAGLGKNLKKVGHYSIGAVVCSSGLFEFLRPQTIRLSFIMKMAEQIVSEINCFFTVQDED
jgi:putative sporulation protein YyaC